MHGIIGQICGLAAYRFFDDRPRFFEAPRSRIEDVDGPQDALLISQRIMQLYLADRLSHSGTADRKSEPLRSVTPKQVIPVAPRLLSKRSIIVEHEEIDSMDELKVAEVREHVWLHERELHPGTPAKASATLSISSLPSLM
jgi:hypothetical protein